MSLVEWCNLNNGFLSLLFSLTAVIISIKVCKSQNKISLFQQRFELYFNILRFIDFAIDYQEYGEMQRSQFNEIIEMEDIFRESVHKSKFLFNEKVSNTLNDCYLDLSRIIRHYHSAPLSAFELDELKADLKTHREEANKQMGKYLTMKHCKKEKKHDTRNVNRISCNY